MYAYSQIQINYNKYLIYVQLRNNEMRLLMVKCGLNLYEEDIGKVHVWNAIEMRYQRKQLSSH